MERILMFNLNPSAESAVKRAALLMKMRVQPVEANQYGSTLENIINKSGEFDYDGEIPEESMIVLCGIAGRRMNELLTSLQRSRAEITYKAVLTQNNYNWTALKMYSEMENEKKAIESASNK